MPEMSEGALDLFAACVAANVDAAAHTTNTLLNIKDDQIRALAQTIVKLDKILADATVIDRATEERLRWMGAGIDNAYETLNRMGVKESL